MIDTNLLLVIALILLSTKALSIFVRKIHMPQIIGALVAGVVLGPAMFGIIKPNEFISTIAEFGVILLLFYAGMETDFKQLKNSLKASLLIAVLGVVAALGGGFAVTFLFGKPSFESFFIGVVIASTSVSITVEALQEMGKLKTKSGTAIMGAALCDDILVIIMLAVVMGMGVSESGFTISSIAIILLKIAAFFVFAIIAGIGVNKLFNFMFDRFGETRRLTVFAIAYCFIMAYLAELFGLAGITGAYIAGIVFCNTHCIKYLEIKTNSLSYMFFTPVFLVNIGLQMSLDGLTGNMILFTVLLVVATILSKVIGCGLGAKICKYTNRESMQIGVGMIARGEVSFIVASKGIVVGYISSQLFPSIIVAVLITVLITPLLLKAVYARDVQTKLE